MRVPIPLSRQDIAAAAAAADHHRGALASAPKIPRFLDSEVYVKPEQLPVAVPLEVIKKSVQLVLENSPIGEEEIAHLVESGAVKVCMDFVPSLSPTQTDGKNGRRVIGGGYPADRRGAKARRERAETHALKSASIDAHTLEVYGKAERKKKIARYMEKRLRRKWHHAIQLKCRQVFATNRPRVNGRFVALPLAICPLIAKGVDMRNYDLHKTAVTDGSDTMPS